MRSQRGMCLHWSQMVGGGLAYTGSIIPADRRIKRAKHPGRVSADDHARRYVVEDHGVNPDHRIAPDPDPRQNRDLAADPDVRFDDYRLRGTGASPVAGRLGVGEMIAHFA